MLPYIEIFGRQIPMYGLTSMIGLVLAGFILCYRIKKAGYDENDTILFILTLAVGMVVGGSILYAITNIHLLLAINYPGEIMRVLVTMFSGMVFYGGLIGACIAGLIFLKIKKLPKNVYMDNCALFAPIFHGFARVGCFFGGCCYGIEWEHGFSAAHVEQKLTQIGDVPRFPVQLLEAGCNFILALVIYLILRKGLLKERVFYLYLLCYSVIRFFDEFLRGDEIRGFVGALSTSQFISIFVFAFAAFMLFISPRLPKKAKNVTPYVTESEKK